ncbi:Uncharacterised protein [Mycobacteroides abscessus subsp. abscessus]|uniref:hypothetical protein n=1 Tax=Mycobacteroides abscessus TaxID=36809 RepID=UPI0009263BA9|nr:hypothetical protein [Mycobacteroides abscessus]SIE60164.1 Uncharacterised protein [Mycobacteroides abscessus subsp. abscessus]SKV28027.1 Uncharacterised protein [Mycobacteroides abscessus subsp. abscessus]
MSARKYIYRVVVDDWPTEDGMPFIDQDWRWWEQIVDYFHNPEGDDPSPAWLPDITEYLEDPGDEWTPAGWVNKPRFTRLVCEPGDEPDYPNGCRVRLGPLHEPAGRSDRHGDHAPGALCIPTRAAVLPRAALGDWEVA